MQSTTQEFLNIITERGFLHQSTNSEGFAAQAAITGYIGFDCTADSLHVGSLVQIMLLRWLQKCGGKPIVLLGGGTTRIGDPSGKDAARQMLTPEQISINKQGIRRIFDAYLEFGDADNQAMLVDNADWLLQLEYIDFLQHYGRHFSVNRMLSFDSVKLRLEREQPLSFLEFNYMILQAYDFLELHKRLGCSLQMGGSDQWGNIINGVELVRRVLGKEVFGITSPLLTTASGAKMGKTAEGAIWLTADKLSPYDFWQFWRNTEDADVERFLKLFTELDLREIQKLSALQGAEINEAKKILATEVTALCHGKNAAQQAAATAAATFAGGGLGEDLPSVTLTLEQLETGVPLVDVLLEAGLISSKGEGRRLIKSGAVKIENVPITEEFYQFTTKNLAISTENRISVGKKKHLKLQVK